MADAALNPAPSADAGAPAPSKPWYDGVAGVDQEIVGHWQNRGWDKKSAAEVALEATKAWKGAERLVGVPADQVLRVPKEVSDEAGWKAVWSRLGKPAEAKEYDFSAIKFSDGTPLDDAFAESARQWAFKFNLPKDAATGITQEFAKFLDTAETSEKTEREAKLVEQKASLKKNWGANEAANMFVAQRAATALGVAPETVAALESVVGYDKIMEMFRSIGEKIGEDKFVRSDAPGGKGGPMTVEQATAKRADLMSDPVWVKAYQAGDKTKLREMMALQSIITGVQIGA
jgi:hypothetical protein